MDTSMTIQNNLGNQDAMVNPSQPAQMTVEASAADYDSQPGPSTVEAAVTPPAKRRPGRPKGSGKKHIGDTVTSSKVKRPVGRPRKDGFPAGSVGSRRSGRPAGRPRKSAPANLDANANNATQSSSSAYPFGTQSYYSLTSGTLPQWQAALAPSSNTAPTASSKAAKGKANVKANTIIPNNDEWAILARAQPHVFLDALLSSLSAPNPLSGGGPSVEESFKSHLVSLAPNPAQKQGTQSIPSLYSILKTFWLPSSPSYFSLTASASTARVPSEHRFLYWDPQPLVFNGIACPNCSAPLTNNGRIRSGPIKVYDLEKPFFIIGCEYICKSLSCLTTTSPEGRKFASTDSSILRSLPVKLKDEFPAYLMQSDKDAGTGADIWDWQARGVSRSLWNMVRGCLKAGLSRDAIVQVVKSIQSGVPDDQDRQEEEEEAEEEQESREGVQDQDATQSSAQAGDSNKEFGDAYSNAWKANSAVGDATTQTGANAANVTSASTPNSTPQQFGFTPVGPFVTSPYTPYPYPYPYYPQQSTGESSTRGATDTNTTNTTVNTNNTSPSEKKSSAKRPLSSGAGDGASELVIAEPSPKRARHCCKCGKSECKGKGGRSFCLNACQDCGKVDCRGRNSRRPDKRCAEAWA